MIFSVCWGRIQGVTWNLEHLVDVTCRVSCGKSEFKLYKIQTKSENHKTCGGVVLSHVEAVVKNWEDFEQVVTSDAKNPDISTCDHFVSHVITSFLASDVTTCLKYTHVEGIANAVLPFVHLFNVHIFVQLIKYTQRPLHLLLQTKKYIIQFSIFAPINHCYVTKPLYVFFYYYLWH